MNGPRSLIINSPYDPPAKHWQPGAGGALSIVESRNYVKRILVLAESYRSLYSDLS